MRAFVQYTAARIAIFLACWGLLWLVGAKGVLGILLALVVSGLVSYVVLDRIRGRFASAVSGSFTDFRARFAAGKAAEDEPAPTDAHAEESQPVDDPEPAKDDAQKAGPR